MTQLADALPHGSWQAGRHPITRVGCGMLGTHADWTPVVSGHTELAWNGAGWGGDTLCWLA